MELQKFSQLEEKIKKIVSEKVSLKKQIQILEEALRNKEAELVGLKNKLKTLDEERNSVRARVDSLLELLADIELAK
ncbi:MAG TPA: cell division protein ZapB [Smithellaceae bacterium]|nr:cell division protein ZapB [Smithellaceae bacterium]HRS89888.1 cell division protein ZapB [Smithellaceae bacterium]HRV26713.1 cell division protein ZapB [Smithellaceae bacterium]